MQFTKRCFDYFGAICNRTKVTFYDTLLLIFFPRHSVEEKNVVVIEVITAAHNRLEINVRVQIGITLAVISDSFKQSFA